MRMRHAAALGLVAALAVTARAGQPAPKKAPGPTEAAFGAAAAVAKGAGTANVVPGSFRALLVVDKRFPLKNKKLKEGDPVKEEDRDPRDRTGKIHCLVCEHGLAPVVAIFVRGELKGLDANKGLGKLIKDTDTLIPKHQADKLSAFAMFLKIEGGPKLVTVKAPDGSEEKVEAAKEYPDEDVDKREKAAKELADFAALVKANNVPFGLAPNSSPSITAFGIAETTPVTVIIYKGMRMARRWELKTDELTDQKIAEILSATENMITGPKK